MSEQEFVRKFTNLQDIGVEQVRDNTEDLLTHARMVCPGVMVYWSEPNLRQDIINHMITTHAQDFFGPFGDVQDVVDLAIDFSAAHLMWQLEKDSEAVPNTILYSRSSST